MACQRTAPQAVARFSRGLRFCFRKTQVEVLVEVVDVCGVAEGAQKVAWRRILFLLFGKGILSQLPWSGWALKLGDRRGDY